MSDKLREAARALLDEVQGAEGWMPKMEKIFDNLAAALSPPAGEGTERERFEAWARSIDGGDCNDEDLARDPSGDGEPYERADIHAAWAAWRARAAGGDEVVVARGVWRHGEEKSILLGADAFDECPQFDGQRVEVIVRAASEREG